MTLDDKKQEARKAASAIRKQAYGADDGSAIERIQAFFIDNVTLGEHSVISGFLPIGSEIDLRPMLADLSDDKHTIVLPCVVGKNVPLLFREWKIGDPLVEESFGTMAPADDAPEHIPNILFVPMLSFDKAGYRLGYGGGFYDRTLEKIRAQKKVIAIGVAYGEQLVDEVPRGEYDQPLDLIVTDEGIIVP